jgi:hypothetical protein
VTSVARVEEQKSFYQRGEEIGAEITELCGCMYAATYRLLVLIRQFDEENLWGLPGLYSCAHWLNWKCGIGMNAAREKVRVANALPALTKISDAFSRGEISYSKVRAMTRVANEENEDFLLMIARHGTAHHLESMVAKYRRAVRHQDLELANQQYAERSAHYYFDDDGSFVINARFPSEQGALIMNALDLAIDQKDVSAETTEPHASFSARRADAIAEMAESYLACGLASSSSADRYQVMIHVTAETSDDAEATNNYIEHGPHVTAETSRRIACDSSISILHEDQNGQPLNIGRKSRVIPPTMRRALRARDEGCRFPGCTHKYFIDGHHIEHWADGGETSLENLVQLCRHHHRLVHEGEFICERHDDGQVLFRDQVGQVIDTTGYMPPCDYTLAEYMRQRMEDLYIDSETCVSKWYAGDLMDYDLAVGSMFQCADRTAAKTNNKQMLI